MSVDPLSTICDDPLERKWTWIALVLAAFMAGILGFFELGWYSGNIVSSANAAHKWNRREQGRFLRDWEGSALPQWRLVLGGDSCRPREDQRRKQDRERERESTTLGRNDHAP
jgi:hypothetical protein